VSLRSTCLLVCVLLLSATAAASADCDQACSFIQLVLGDRSSGFAEFKGAHSFVTDAGDSWASKSELPGMHCAVNNNWAFQCATQPGTLTEAEAQKKFGDLLVAFRQASPAWKFFKGESKTMTEICGGPAGGDFVISLIIISEVDDPGLDDVSFSIAAKGQKVGVSSRFEPYWGSE
jgi:hypothetical protein